MDFSYTARGIANAIWNATRDGTWRSDEQVEGLAEELAHRIHAERLHDEGLEQEVKKLKSEVKSLKAKLESHVPVDIKAREAAVSAMEREAEATARRCLTEEGRCQRIKADLEAVVEP